MNHEHSFCVDASCECGMRLSTLVNLNNRMLSALKDAAITIEARCKIEGIPSDASPTLVHLYDVISLVKAS